MSATSGLIGLISALVIALCGVFLGRRSKESAKKPSPQEGSYEAVGGVVNEQAAKVQEAGEQLAENLAGTSSQRAASILAWYRKRTAGK